MIFKNKEGRYELEDGTFLSSPSRILKPLTLPKYKDIPAWQLEKAADFGKEIHEAIEIYHRLDQDYEEVKQLLYTTKHINTFNQYLNWLKEYNVRVLEVEKLVWSFDGLYFGYIDLLCEINGTLNIVDIKTRSNLNSDDDYLIEKLQVMLYLYAYVEVIHKKQIDKNEIKTSILIINKNTKSQKKYFEFLPNDKEICVLNLLVKLEQHLNERKVSIN